MDRRFRLYDFKVDIEKLKEETHRILWDSTTGRYQHQLSLQTNGDNDWQSGTGKREGQDEAQWDKLHPNLVGTWWEGFLTSFPFKVYRARLMTMYPRTCYSIHTDMTPRVHIPIVTHRQARFIFTDPPILRHLPADGSVWWVDTTKEHSAMNGSLIDRIHLVMCLVNTNED
jgi:hypothetical protein